jgi:ATP adenylyltransferase
VRKLFQKPGCVFCQAIAGGVGFENLLLYKDEEALVVLNKFPYNTGHLLVLPHRHCGHPLDLSEAEYQRVQQITRVSLYALEDCYQADGLNLGLNLGAAAGAGIPDHMHYHLIPRWSGDANFFPLVAETKVIVETLEETYRRLLPYYQERFEEILESVTKGRSD